MILLLRYWYWGASDDELMHTRAFNRSCVLLHSALLVPLRARYRAAAMSSWSMFATGAPVLTRPSARVVTNKAVACTAALKNIGAPCFVPNPARERSSRRPVSVSAHHSSVAEVNTPAQKSRAVLRAPKGPQQAPKLLSRIEALRLLSKVEDAGLLSLGACAGAHCCHPCSAPLLPARCLCP